MKRSTVVTEKNIHVIYGKLKRFFYNKNDTGFIMYHNFDCGWKNIKPYHIKQKIIKPDYVELDKINNTRFIRITLQNGVSGFAIELGDRIQFFGNKIIFQSKCKHFGGNDYSYEVFEQVELSEADLDDIYNRRCEEEYSASAYYSSLDEWSDLE